MALKAVHHPDLDFYINLFYIYHTDNNQQPTTRSKFMQISYDLNLTLIKSQMGGILCTASSKNIRKLSRARPGSNLKNIRILKLLRPPLETSKPTPKQIRKSPTQTNHAKSMEVQPLVGMESSHKVKTAK